MIKYYKRDKFVADEVTLNGEERYTKASEDLYKT